jgi:hypothetical protein
MTAERVKVKGKRLKAVRLRISECGIRNEDRKKLRSRRKYRVAS